MAISGRVPLLLLLGLVPVVLRPAMGTTWLWLLVVVVAVGLDWLAAPRPEALRLERRPLSSVRTGYPTTTTLVATNAGRRTLRGVVRDAWQPTRRRHRQPAPGPADGR